MSNTYHNEATARRYIRHMKAAIMHRDAMSLDSHRWPHTKIELQLQSLIMRSDDLTIDDFRGALDSRAPR